MAMAMAVATFLPYEAIEGVELRGKEGRREGGSAKYGERRHEDDHGGD